jgi:hypothetical protein
MRVNAVAAHVDFHRVGGRAREFMVGVAFRRSQDARIAVRSHVKFM